MNIQCIVLAIAYCFMAHSASAMSEEDSYYYGSSYYSEESSELITPKQASAFMKKQKPEKQKAIRAATREAARAARSARKTTNKEGKKIQQLQKDWQRVDNDVHSLEEALDGAQEAAQELNEMSVQERETSRCCYKTRNIYGKKECGGSWYCCFTCAFSCFCGKKPTLN